MKKRSFKLLILNKKSISLISKHQILGGDAGSSGNAGKSSDDMETLVDHTCYSCYGGDCGDWD